MTASRDSLADAQRRIRDLESMLEQSRCSNEAHRKALHAVTGSWFWRVSGPLRRLLARWKGPSAAPPGGPDPVVPVMAAGQPLPEPAGAVAALLRTLPAEALAIEKASPGDRASAYRLVDFASPMATMLGARAIDLLTLSAADAGTVHAGRSPNPARIALLASSELMRELAFDAAVTPLHEASWEEQLSQARHDFLLVEAIWHVDNREWRYSLTRDGAGRPLVERLFHRCRELGVPVVLWYRETLANYAEFAWLAGHADVVHAIDPVAAGRFSADFPGRAVACLPPSVQPALHNPVVPAALARAARARHSRVLFDGWKAFTRHDRADQERLLSSLPGLLIAESRWDMGIAAWRDSPGASEHVLGCLGPVERACLPRLAGAELFPESGGGDGWREVASQLQAAASGALPVGPGVTRSAGIIAAGDAPTGPLQHARAAHLLFREVFSAHCLAHRLQRVAEDLARPLDFIGGAPTVACLLVTMRPHLVEACIERFRRDLYPNKELVVVVHDETADIGRLRSFVRPGERVRIFRRGREQGLGACLNFAFAQTGAEYWCKVDDDDFYGPRYLSDFMLYRRAVDFDLAGKPMAFTLLDEADELRWDQRWANRANLFKTPADTARTGVAGATLFGHRRVLEATPFSERRARGTDTEFLHRCHADGWNLLSTDPFNFVRYRTERSDFHTWRLGPDRIRERTERVGGRADLAAVAFA